MGCGQLEFARTLFGKLRPAAGHISMEGRPRALRNTSQARRTGIAFVPESRRSMLFHHQPGYKNISIGILEKISRLWLRPNAERSTARGHVESLHIRPPRVDVALGSLSGGNQQKVALAKWLTHAPKVLILSEPTRGMDVGAKDVVV